MSRPNRNRIIIAAIALVLFDAVQAQGIMLARRVVGRIVQMSQTSPNGATTYDTASVIVEVPVDRVYEAVKTQVRTAQGITVTKEDAAARRVEFTNGTQIAGIQAVSLADNVTQLMVSSAHSSAPTGVDVRRQVAFDRLRRNRGRRLFCRR